MAWAARRRSTASARAPRHDALAGVFGDELGERRVGPEGVGVSGAFSVKAAAGGAGIRQLVYA